VVRGTPEETTVMVGAATVGMATAAETVTGMAVEMGMGVATETVPAETHSSISLAALACF
jgi:hypothetical protein